MQPNFNYEGETTALYCSPHKVEGMVDVKKKKCIHEGCKIQPTFNYEGETTALYCSRHKVEGMRNVKSKTCIHEGCKKIPAFNNDGETNALYCSAHKLKGMRNVVSLRCIHEGCYTITNGLKKYDGYCQSCYTDLFPDNPKSRNIKVKEKAVANHLWCQDKRWEANKSIHSRGIRREPDLLIDLVDKKVIAEIDENKHDPTHYSKKKNIYSPEYDKERTKIIYEGLGKEPLIFIRFNPDKYKKKDGSTITSCWGKDQNGVCVLKNSKQNEWRQRLNALDEEIKYWMNPLNKPTEPITIVYLFYDE